MVNSSSFKRNLPVIGPLEPTHTMQTSGTSHDAIEVCTNLEDLSDRDPERPTRHDSRYNREGTTRYPGWLVVKSPSDCPTRAPTRFD